ncbi:hypothetical protein RsY01_2095 [Lactococcus reticulitermitis]|uniref:Uncharacterized protein n=1 Tax=Pseudolactococcus reticulitermitis TaxID=2025039 RepID=A0A224X7S0_9LACT|nr:hypothetical protein RsY01_2095 [Lactococcus reticulitermitis]
MLFGFIALLVFMIYDVSSRSDDIATIFIGLFAAILLFYRHRLFAIGLTEGQDILVEIEKNTE